MSGRSVNPRRWIRNLLASQYHSSPWSSDTSNVQDSCVWTRFQIEHFWFSLKPKSWSFLELHQSESDCFSPESKCFCWQSWTLDHRRTDYQPGRWSGFILSIFQNKQKYITVQFNVVFAWSFEPHNSTISASSGLLKWGPDDFTRTVWALRLRRSDLNVFIVRFVFTSSTRTEWVQMIISKITSLSDR